MTSAQSQPSEMTQGSVSLSSMACRNVFLDLGELCKEDFISCRRGMGEEGWDRGEPGLHTLHSDSAHMEALFLTRTPVPSLVMRKPHVTLCGSKGSVCQSPAEKDSDVQEYSNK